MTKILGILQDAERSKADQDPAARPLELSRSEFFDLLGSAVLDYNAFRLMTTMNIVQRFRSSNLSQPSKMHESLLLHAHIITENIRWNPESSIQSPKALGEEFLVHPRRALDVAFSRVKHSASSTLVGVDTKTMLKPPTLDIKPLRLPTPYRRGLADPFVIGKPLNMEKNSMSLLAFLPNDTEFVANFLAHMKSNLAPLYVVGAMVMHELEGASAFNMNLLSLLKNPGSEYFRCHPFDNSGRRRGFIPFKHLDIVKAVIASRSKLLQRLWSLGSYRVCLSRTSTSNNINNDASIHLQARMFDRYFALCYREDKVFCMEWMKRLLNFYQENAENETLLDDLATEAARYYQDVFAEVVLERSRLYWKKVARVGNRRSLRSGSEKMSTEHEQTHQSHA